MGVKLSKPAITSILNGGYEGKVFWYAVIHLSENLPGDLGAEAMRFREAARSNGLSAYREWKKFELRTDPLALQVKAETVRRVLLDEDRIY